MHVLTFSCPNNSKGMQNWVMKQDLASQLLINPKCIFGDGGKSIDVRVKYYKHFIFGRYRGDPRLSPL